MSSAASRGAAGWLYMQNRVINIHFEDLKRERAIREKKESAAPRVVSGTKVNQPTQVVAGLSETTPVYARPLPAARAPVVLKADALIAKHNLPADLGEALARMDASRKPVVVYKRRRRVEA